MKYRIKPLEVEAVQWHDNLSEVKLFCPGCTITYEYAPGIDCYYSLKIYDDLRNAEFHVPLDYYIVKLGTGVYTAVEPSDFKDLFTPFE